MCGEHDIISSWVPACWGSSPRVRGTPAVDLPHPIEQWFIPACAGNTASCSRKRSISSVHPRVCGEHSASRSVASALSGSSPRVRGTQLQKDRVTPLPRFIPACAGNTARCPSWNIDDYGSSPRVRGTRHHTDKPRPHPRFIPACAGNTRGVTPIATGCTVHPRVCGEHHAYGSDQVQAIGSSPRVRGTPGR